MDTLLDIGLGNAVMATGLAVVAVIVGYCCRRPALTHGLWLLVLLKLITPPLQSISFSWPTIAEPVAEEIAPPPPIPRVEVVETVVRWPESALEMPEPEPVIPEEPGREVPDEALPQPERVPLALPIVGADSPQSLAPVITAPEPLAPPPPLTPSWRELAGIVWLAGTVIWFAWAGTRIWRFRQMLRLARPAPAELQELSDQVAERLELELFPSVWLMPGRVSPMLWAAGGNPRLLLPVQLFRRLGADQRETLLAHELAHLRRRDHWVRGLELVATGLYWWLPVVWWARRQLREAEEECCDAWVVWALPRAARAYALALVETVDFLSEGRPVLPPVASGIGHFQILKRRLTMIMRGTTPRALSSLGLLALLGLAALLLPWLPILAQDEPPGRPNPGERIRKEDEERVRVIERRARAEDERGDQLEQARREVKQLTDQLKQAQMRLQEQMEIAKQHLMEGEKRLQEAQRRLSDLEIKRKVEAVKSRVGQEDAHKRKIIAIEMERDGNDARPKGAAEPGAVLHRGGPPQDVERRLADLERKMDRLLQEMAALRGALGRGSELPPGGGRPPAGRFVPPGGSRDSRPVEDDRGRGDAPPTPAPNRERREFNRDSRDLVPSPPPGRNERDNRPPGGVQPPPPSRERSEAAPAAPGLPPLPEPVRAEPPPPATPPLPPTPAPARR